MTCNAELHMQVEGSVRLLCSQWGVGSSGIEQQLVLVSKST